jgi:hypothetical protein
LAGEVEGIFDMRFVWDEGGIAVVKPFGILVE